MTVISLQWFAPRPRRRPAASHAAAFRATASRYSRPGRRPYRDPFFADPAAVEDDTRRMTRDAPAR
jgi:hypothetical protein